MSQTGIADACSALWGALRDLADRLDRPTAPVPAPAAEDYVDEGVVSGQTETSETVRAARNAGGDARADSTTGSCPTCKVAFLIGHSTADGGAYSPHIDEQEWSYNNDIAQRAIPKIEALSDGRVSAEIFYRVRGGGYTAEMRAAYAQVNAYLEGVPNDKKIAFELHFNSIDGSADYALVLYDENEGESGFAQRAASRMGAIYGASRSLIKHYADNGTGHAGFQYGPPNTFLMEPFFGSDERTANIAATEEGRDALAQVYAELLVEWTQ